MSVGFPCALFVATTLTAVLGCGDDTDPHATRETGADQPAVDALFAAWQSSGSPGCALAVAREDVLVYSRGYGYANLDYEIPITPQTVFDVASITKQFVAAGLTMLALEEKLSLDDDVRVWLPELPEHESKLGHESITLRQMIHHTSGLRDYLNLFPLAGRGDYYPISHEQILAMMSRQRSLVFPPGERYLYSNTAYMLLAQVLERASGQSLGELASERIFEPLGMQGSLMYEDLEQIIPRRATGYFRDEEGNLRISHNYNFDVAGDGQLYSTVEDLLLWDGSLHGTRPPIYEMMLTEGSLNNGEAIGYAQGIKLGDYRGLDTVGHSGSSWGFRSQLLRFVEPELSIAVACNSDDAKAQELAYRVADQYLADQLGPREELSEEEPADSEELVEYVVTPAGRLEDYVGRFFSEELDATYRFAIEEGDLVARIEQEPTLRVTPVGDDIFEIQFYDQGWPGPQNARLAFGRDSSGAVTGFGLSSGSEQGILFERQ